MTINQHETTDEGRIQQLVDRLQRHQTDTHRLWNRVDQTPDGIGTYQTGLETPALSAAIVGTTTTPLPTTTTTTTPAAVVEYLYPYEDTAATNIDNSSGTDTFALIDERETDWPDHLDYFSVQESTNASLEMTIEPVPPFASMASAELQLYCKNELDASEILTFAAQIIGDDGATHLTDLVNVTGYGSGESSFSLLTATFTLEADAQDFWQWSRPTLVINIETDAAGGSPELFVSAVRVKVTYSPFP